MSARDYAGASRAAQARLPRRVVPDRALRRSSAGFRRRHHRARRSTNAEIARPASTSYDPRYFTTYYAIDAINFKPVDLSSALDTLDAPYLPLVVQEAAGLPLDPSFAEQKKILQRCHGLFYGCAGGAEARRFNRLLIDAGLIKGL